MRFVTFQLVPESGYLHPIERAVTRAGLQRVAIHQFRSLSDDTAVTLYELHGDREDAVAVLSEHPDVVSYDVVESGEGSEELFVHSRFELDELTAGVYAVPRTHDLVLDMPMLYADRGALEVTAVGDFETFRAAIEDVPDGVGMRLLRTGEYAPEGEHLFAQLTDRQQETLRAAVEAGYYEEPRGVTYEEVADRLDVAAGTVGEHLRKIEATVLKGVLPEA